MPACYWFALGYPGDDKVVHFSSPRTCSCCFLQPVFVAQVLDFCVLMVTRWLRIFQTRYFLSLVFHDYIMFLKISCSWVCFAARLFLKMVQNAERLPIAECHSKVVKFCKFIEWETEYIKFQSGWLCRVNWTWPWFIQFLVKYHWPSAGLSTPTPPPPTNVIKYWELIGLTNDVILHDNGYST